MTLDNVKPYRAALRTAVEDKTSWGKNELLQRESEIYVEWLEKLADNTPLGDYGLRSTT